MQRKGLFHLFLGLPLAMLLAGCGDSGGQTSKGRFSFKKKDSETASRQNAKSTPPSGRMNQAVSADLGDLTPESSMRRDLTKLRERERDQARTINEMRTALHQAEDMVVKEERKLDDLRTQINRYENVMRGYEETSYNRSSHGREAPVRNSDSRHASIGGEETWHSSRLTIPANSAPQQPSHRDYAGPGGNEPLEKTFAGATVGRSRFPESRAKHADDEEELWSPPPRFFSDQAPPSRSPVAQAPVRPPAAPPPAPSPAPPAKPAVELDDMEVFTPDLFLPGTRR